MEYVLQWEESGVRFATAGFCGGRGDAAAVGDDGGRRGNYGGEGSGR